MPATAALEGSRSLPPTDRDGGVNTILPSTVQLRPFSGLLGHGGRRGGGRNNHHTPPPRRPTEEDIFGSSLRSMSLPGGSLSFVSPAAQLLLASPPGLAAGFASATPLGEFNFIDNFSPVCKVLFQTMMMRLRTSKPT